MDGQFRIETLYACIVVDDDGTEGVPAIMGPGGMAMPLMGADRARLESLLMPAAQQIATELGKKVTICEFSIRTELQVVDP